MSFAGRNFVSLSDFTKDEIDYLMKVSARFDNAISEGSRTVYAGLKYDDMIATLFFENSTRTYQSFARAINLLGGSSQGFFSTEGTSLMKGESLRHTLEMFRVYGARAIVMRHPLDGAARFATTFMDDIPIINAGDGKHEHPTQTLLDRYSMLQAFDRLDPECPNYLSLRGLTILLVGDLLYGRVPHSLVKEFSRDQVHFIFVAPKIFQMSQIYLDIIESHGSTYEIHESLTASAVSRADALMSLRIQAERIGDVVDLDVIRREFRLLLPMIEAHAKSTAKVFHPLPIFSRYPEIDPAIDDSNFEAYFRQAGNGVPTRLALLRLLIDDSFEDFKGEEWAPAVVVGQDEIGVERSVSDEPLSMADLSIRPIRERGVAIDHLPPGMEQAVLKIMNVAPGEVYRVGTVRSHKDPARVKGLVLIENQNITDAQMRLIQAAVGWQSSPHSPVTVNFIENGKVIRKIDLVMPGIIEGSGVCPNIVRDKDGSPKGGCISRPEFYQHVTPRFIHEGAGKFRCYYCDHTADSRVIFR